MRVGPDVEGRQFILHGADSRGQTGQSGLVLRQQIALPAQLLFEPGSEIVIHNLIEKLQEPLRDYVSHLLRIKSPVLDTRVASILYG